MRYKPSGLHSNTPFSFSCASYQIRSGLGTVGGPLTKLLQLFGHMWEG